MTVGTIITLLPGCTPSSFDLAQEGDQPCADIELLHFVAAQRADDGAGLFAFAEAIGHDVHIIPEIRREGEQNILFHARSFLILAISVPGYTEE